VTVLEGESLVNDATGLVAYRFAVAAVMTGAFSLWGAGGNFVLMAAGGIAIGLTIGWVVTRLFAKVEDDTIVIALSVAAPYVSWYLAERLHVSAVLAAVTGGIVIGARSQALSANARLQGSGFWNTLVFLLNGVVFTLIGLQLPRIIARSHGGDPIGLVRDGSIVSGRPRSRLVWISGRYLPLSSRRSGAAAPAAVEERSDPGCDARRRRRGGARATARAVPGQPFQCVNG
jgi:CPA1 family monovalent cation:H+ antiporter